MKFNKPSIDIDSMIEHMRDRGILIKDQATVRECLGHIPYYRLRAYWKPFSVQTANGSQTMKPGITIRGYSRTLQL